MLFPELHSTQKNSLKASGSFWSGFFRRIFNRKRPKVFVIGFHKTGTSSLGKALQILGYRVCGSVVEAADLEKYPNPQQYLWEQAQKVIPNFDGFQDTPWFLIYESLYEQFPEARFILTLREEDAWMASVQKHFGNSSYAYHHYIYGSEDSWEQESTYRSVYREHNQRAQEFFKGKPHFTVMDMETDFNWEFLCGFLGQSQPSRAFPHANPKGYRNSWLAKLKKKLKKMYYK